MHVQATRNVKHQDTTYTAGMEFDVSEEEGKELVGLGAVVQVKEKPAEKDVAAEKAAAEKAVADKKAADKKAAADALKDSDQAK